MNNFALQLKRQKRANKRDGAPSLGVRKDRLSRLSTMLFEHRHVLCGALEIDYGGRPVHQSLQMEIRPVLENIQRCMQALPNIVRMPQPKSSWWAAIQNSNLEVHYQPKGVVGIVAHWTLPVWTACAPLAAALASGNRSVLLMPASTPATSSALQRLVQQYFSEEEVAVTEGDQSQLAQFSSMAWDHLVYTGSASIAKEIMHHAATHLTPLTLELNGKSPVIIGKETNLKQAAEQVVLAKMINVGQVLHAPDYVFVKDHSLNEFIAELERAWQRYYPKSRHKADMGAVLNEEQLLRLHAWLDDVRSKQGEIWQVYPSRDLSITDEHQFKMIPVLVIDPSDEMLIMQEEISGPILPVKSYRHIDDVIEYIQDHPRPNTLYYFGNNLLERDRVLSNTGSNWLEINGIQNHAAHKLFGSCKADAFASIGYTGFTGMRMFSHERVVRVHSPFFERIKNKLIPTSEERTAALEKEISRYRS